MPAPRYDYLIVGAGLAGASAADGVRERDADGSILLVGAETDPPYHRPNLSKSLWLGRKKVEEIFVHDAAAYAEKRIELLAGFAVSSVDAAAKKVAGDGGREFSYGKLLLATGGSPRRLALPGGDLPGICYYRSLGDYRRIRSAAVNGASATVVGGGFIGSEMAAALSLNGVAVTMIYPETHLCARVFPETLGLVVEKAYLARGVRLVKGDRPASFSAKGDGFVTRTEKGEEIAADTVIVGVGIEPETALARGAGLVTANGIAVDERLRTSNPDIFAAGDDALFPSRALGKAVRVEHWDNAKSQGAHAGRSMAGDEAPYTYLPYFFSDLYDYGYEAVGEVDTRLRVFPDWEEENRTGVLYYLDRDKVRGVMLWNVWEMTDAARALIAKGAAVKDSDLRGAIRSEG